MKQTPAADRANLPLKLQRKLDRHFLACSATVGASVALAATGVYDAKGDIIYSGTQNIPVPAYPGGAVYFDFDTLAFTPANVAGVSDAVLFDSRGTSTTSNYTYHAFSFFGVNNAANNALATAATGLAATKKLGADIVVGPTPGAGVFGRQNVFALQFYSPSSGAPYLATPFGEWAGGGTGFMGFKFVDANGQTDYGWMRINFDATTFDPAAQPNVLPPATVIDFAYDNSGASILTGQTTAVPEPSTMALGCFAGGAAGLIAWRKRRQQQRKAAEA